MKKVIVIGAGAAGLLASARAAEMGASVAVFERMSTVGRKISISGQGRCNITNSADLPQFIRNYGPNGRFLYSAFSKFFRDDILSILHSHGVDTTVERGGRIFPTSNDANDVVNALKRNAEEKHVHIITGEHVIDIITEEGKVTGIKTDEREFACDAVIVATGGSSFGATGSTGEGYLMAGRLGHHIVEIRPALVPLVVYDDALAFSMQGVSLKNVRLTSYHGLPNTLDTTHMTLYDFGREIQGKKLKYPVIESRFGEMMMTHFGIGGPITLQMSLAVVNALKDGPVSVSIDLKPALTYDQLNLRLQRDFDNGGKKLFRNIVDTILPQKMVAPVIKLSGIDSEKQGHEINAAERNRLATILKDFKFQIKRSLPIDSAIVTAGGVDLKEINGQTMESKIVKDLYFCGEVLDIDADTGGYNLQAAFSTGYVAGESAAKSEE
jgi:predicted flavoprotein YhiN